MRRLLPLACVALFPLASLSGDESGGEPMAMPVPPQQAQPWTPPPTQLPPVVVNAITELFNEGLADPRGCDYREIEVRAGIDLNIKTHGWILPGDGKSRFAVGWNGLVYPVATMGAPADLSKDVAALLAKDEKQWASYTGSNRDVRGRWIAPEWAAISHENILPLKVAMLLRLGRADLAGLVWDRWFALSSGGKDDPYLLLAREWIGSLYNHALFAHMRGDDAVSLATCRTLLPLRSTVEAAAVRRGLPPDAPGKPYLDDLDELPELAADQERRAQEPPYTPVLESGLPAQGPERIAALIRDLELVSAHQWMNPGQTDVYNDPIVQALIKEGDVAVEPLLQCFEEDTRLTRSEFTQGMQIRPGPIIHVYEPAYIALDGILQMPFYFSDLDNKEPPDPSQNSDPRDRHPRDLTLDDRKFLGEKIRAYWKKNKGLSLPERWYATLQDDNAGANDWIDAIGKIGQPTDQLEISFGIYGGSMGWGYPLQTGKPMKGEPLRGKSNPSVSDLIIKRFRQLMSQVPFDSSLTYDQIGKVILVLAYWDGKAHLDDIRDFTEAYLARFPQGQDYADPMIDIRISIYQRELYLGDPHALQDYADWLTSLSPKDVLSMWRPTCPSRAFQIMWHYPNDPVIQKVAEKMFTGKDTPLVPLPNTLVHTPLIGLMAFRQELERGLNDNSPAGTIQVTQSGFNYDFKLTGTTSGESSDPPQIAPFEPKPGSVVAFRLCDCYAYQLSQVAGFPECKLYWPEAKRDVAVAACKAFLQQYGNDYQSRPDAPYDDTVGAPDAGTAVFHMPQLDHPATPDDVKAGRAIFSLSGTRRVWKMPTFPLGPAWQAEEVLVNGKWERYFGILSEGKPMKVPASEIDFPDNYSCPGKITKKISGGIVGPSDRDSSEFNMSYGRHHPVLLAAPVPVTVVVYNHSGLDQSVPDSVMLPPGATRTLPEGIGFSVSYSEKLPPMIQRFSEPPFDYGTFQDIPLRQDVTVNHEKTVGPTLGPTQYLTVLKIDLRDFFDMSRPGSYHVKAFFHVPGQPAEQSNECDFLIADVPH